MFSWFATFGFGRVAGSDEAGDADEVGGSGLVTSSGFGLDGVAFRPPSFASRLLRICSCGGRVGCDCSFGSIVMNDHEQ